MGSQYFFILSLFDITGYFFEIFVNGFSYKSIIGPVNYNIIICCINKRGKKNILIMEEKFVPIKTLIKILTKTDRVISYNGYCPLITLLSIIIYTTKIKFTYKYFI